MLMAKIDKRHRSKTNKLSLSIRTGEEYSRIFTTTSQTAGEPLIITYNLRRDVAAFISKATITVCSESEVSIAIRTTRIFNRHNITHLRYYIVVSP